MLKIVMRTFLKTMGVILLLLGVGVGSYFLTLLYLRTTERDERSKTYEHVIDINVGTESSNLIYSVDTKSKKVKAIVLELFDKETGNLDYITFPVNTQISLSKAKYEEYLKINSQIPQIVTLGDINQYFGGDVAYEYGILLLQEDLKVDIGYFTAMDSVEFNKRFDKKNEIYKPSQEYLETAAQNKDEASMKKFIEKEWDSVISDITLSQKHAYAAGFLKVKLKCIRAHKAYAEELKGKATLDGEKTKKMINRIWESPERTEKTKKSGNSGGKSGIDKIKSKGIQITNGSNINGLAASFKSKLEADGLNVLGVGDFSGAQQTQTVIYAKKKEWADCLKPYFRKASVQESQTLTNGADIEVILGTDEKPEPSASVKSE